MVVIGKTVVALQTYSPIVSLLTIKLRFAAFPTSLRFPSFSKGEGSLYHAYVGLGFASTKHVRVIRSFASPAISSGRFMNIGGSEKQESFIMICSYIIN